MNIWQIVEYSLVVTVVALLLLAMKRLFHDKLDARWHYFIWMVLAVRMLVPLELAWLKSPLSLFEAIPVNYWARLWELKITRAGLAQAAQDIMPWYLAGVALLAGYYLMIAVIIRINSSRLPQADAVICENIAEIAGKYGLKSCKRIKLTQKGSTYICGLFRPILVLSVGDGLTRTSLEGTSLERTSLEGTSLEQMVLHELLHKKHGDVLINYVLHLVRVVNWFNPLIWYVTAVILNDSEALCDQRVLELMRSRKDREVVEASGEKSISGTNGASESAEKQYGDLLIRMAEKKGSRSAKIGTTNMANSYRSMRTRIRRIADFRRVPSGVGFVALCITIILSVSSIGYCEGKNIISSGVEDEADLNRVLLRAQLYDAETPQEAIYLYLKAMKEMNPVYLMAVMPKEEIAEYEDWIYTMFRQDRFVRYQDGAIVSPKWINFNAEMAENPWFTQNGDRMQGCTIYSLKADETKGTAVAALSIEEPGMENDEVYWWELALSKEDGWKVARVGEHVGQEAYEPAPVVELTRQSGDWLVGVSGQNEASFHSIYQSNNGFHFYTNGQTAPTEETLEYPKQFEMIYKMKELYVTYQGKESLGDTVVEVAVRVFTQEEYEKMEADGFSLEQLAAEKLPVEEVVKQVIFPERASQQELARLSGDQVAEEAVEEEESYTAGGYISSSDGAAYKRFKGSELVSGKKVWLSGGGSGYDSWEETDTLQLILIAWIYYDGECVEVIGK